MPACFASLRLGTRHPKLSPRSADRHHPLLPYLVSVGALLAALVLGVTPVRGATVEPQHGLVLDPGQPTEQLAPLVASLVDLRVRGMVARATVTQQFVHPGDRPVEALFVFPLPANAAVDGLRLTVGDRVTEGQIQPLPEAEATFAEARQAGRTAVLLEQLRDDRFAARVTQLAPGDTVEVELSLGFEVRYDQGTFQLRFPLASPRRDGAPSPPELPTVPTSPTEAGADPLALRLELEAGVPLARLDSPSHALTVDAPTLSRRIVELAAGVVDADRDFVVEWAPQTADAPRAAAYLETHDDAHFGLLMVLPPDAQAIRPIPREIYFVLDISRSMRGPRLDNACKALALGIAGLDDTDHFNVVYFDDQVDFLWRASRPASADARQTATQSVQSAETRGGTNIFGALTEVLARPTTPDRLQQIVLITDGQIQNQVSTYQLLRRELGDRRLFTVGMGSAPNTAFMRRAAELGRGTHTFIEQTRRIEAQIATLLDKLATPAMVDLEILWDDPSAESFPRTLPDLYAGEPLVVAVRSQHPPAGRLLGWRDGQPWEQRFDLAGQQQSLVENARGIDQRWARRKVEHIWLADQLDELDPETTARAEITTLALQHRLVSAYTALVAVDPQARVTRGSALLERTVARSPVADSVPSTTRFQEETIVVTGELSSTLASSQSGTTFRHDEVTKLQERFESQLDAVPGLLGQASGSRQSAVDDRAIALPGTLPDATRWSLDLTPIEGPVPGRRSALPFLTEVEVGRGGSEIHTSSEGTHLVLTTRSAGNTRRMALRAVGGGGLDSASQVGEVEGAQRSRSTHHLAADVGTALRKDHAWLWLGVAQRDDRRLVSGPEDPVETGHRDHSQAANLDLQAGRSQATLRLFRGEDLESGRWAGRDRTPEASLEAQNQLQTGSLQASWASADLVLEGHVSVSQVERSTEPTASTAALWDATGVLRGSWRHDHTEQTRNGVRVSASRLYDRTLWGSPQDHDVDLGASATQLDDRLDRRGPASSPGRRTLSIAGDALGVADQNLAWIELTGKTVADRTSEAVWLQDTLHLPTLEITAGVRWDRWRGQLDQGAPSALSQSVAGTSEIDWQSLSPRFAASWQPAFNGALTLRVGWSRFARQLDADTLWSASPEAIGRALVAFDDLDGNRLLGAEPTTLLDTQGFATGHRFAEGLDPEITDEINLGIELSPTRPWHWRLLVVRRETRDIHELRRLVDDGGGPRLAVPSDYRFDHTLTAALPDGGVVSAPVFSLSQGVTDLGSGLWIQGDLRRVFEGVTLEAERRWGWGWARGALQYGEHRWRPGEDFEQHTHRPPRLGHNAAVLDGPSDPDLGDDWHGGRWTVRLEGGLTVAEGKPWSFDLAAVLSGREGNPLPWFAHDLASADGRLRQVALGPLESHRLTDPWTLDLQFAKTLELGQGPELHIDLTLRNLLDTDPVIRRELDLASPRAGQVEARLAGREVTLGARLVW